MISRQELLEDNEELIGLLNDVLVCAEEQGVIIPEELQARIAEFLIIEDEEFEDGVIEIKPS